MTPIVTILIGIGAAYFIAAPIGKGAMAVGTLIKWATTQQPFVMGVLVSVIVGIRSRYRYPRRRYARR